jgi:hypothetical protein
MLAGNLDRAPIEEKLRVLQAMKHALTQLVEECPGEGAVTDCPILESLTMEERVWHAAKNV